MNGGVLQGTLSGPELFIHMLSDFNTVARCVKYVDDSTLLEVAKKKLKSDKMQEATNQTVSWSKENNLGINEAKTKNLLISFGSDLDIPLLDTNRTQIERVHHSKLLGVIISDDLKWGAHILYINSRAGKCIFYLRELKRSGVLQSYLVHIYRTLVRPVVEYACQVWFTGLTKEQSQTLESIQTRALSIISP